MKHILIITILLLNFTAFCGSLETGDKPLWSLDRLQSDMSENMKYKFQNPFRGSDFSWFKDQYRLNKILIASGTVTFAVGTPFLISGLYSRLAPNTDTNDNTRTLNYVFIGLGGGFLLLGLALGITGGVLYYREYKKAKENSSKVSINFELRLLSQPEVPQPAGS